MLIGHVQVKFMKKVIFNFIALFYEAQIIDLALQKYPRGVIFH